MNSIEIKNLSKNYKEVKALDNVSFEIEEKEIFGLLGTNGAGKTTLIKIISSLTKATSGEVVVYGNSIDKEKQKIKEMVDISPQETSIAPNLTVIENLRFFANIYYSEKADIDNKIKEIIEIFSLESVINQKAKTLSGGYQRRLSIALALISNPKIILLDEPTLGLDVIARRQLWNILNKLKDKITIVLTSHYLEEIEFLCKRVAIMSHGKIVTIGTIEEILENSKEKTFEDAFIKIVESGEEA